MPTSDGYEDFDDDFDDYGAEDEYDYDDDYEYEYDDADYEEEDLP